MFNNKVKIFTTDFNLQTEEDVKTECEKILAGCQFEPITEELPHKIESKLSEILDEAHDKGIIDNVRPIVTIEGNSLYFKTRKVVNNYKPLLFESLKGLIVGLVSFETINDGDEFKKSLISCINQGQTSIDEMTEEFKKIVKDLIEEDLEV